MSIPPSAAANLTLPRWAYVPGVETEADHDTLAMAKALVPARFNGFVPARHPALRYGLGLNDCGFFWESHEILEAVWAAAPQGGRERILLRACIQIANANLKLRMGKPHAAARLFGEALAELNELGVRKATGRGDGFADGFPTAALAARLRSRLAQPSLLKSDWIGIGTIHKT
ncbi:DUF309 domain-containing protein [uncultured Bradyrhizobium sp.]|uniref:DUF309 domain-containing protein n=1 Tax=uncultured Bradyrhizobium sp. TaxID=199684 RepID=UPI0035CA1AA7